MLHSQGKNLSKVLSYLKLFKNIHNLSNIFSVVEEYVALLDQ